MFMAEQRQFNRQVRARKHHLYHLDRTLLCLKPQMLYLFVTQMNRADIYG